MGVLKFSNKNELDGFYPENEVMPQASAAKRLLKNQIKEFYARVMDDVNFKNAIIAFLQEINAPEVTPRLTALVIKEVILPYSRYLGYNFSLRDLLDFEANEKVMVKIPAEEMAMITGGGEGIDNALTFLAGFAEMYISRLFGWWNSDSWSDINSASLALAAFGAAGLLKGGWRLYQILSAHDNKKPGAPPPSAGGINISVNEPKMGNTSTVSGNTVTNSSVTKTD